MSYDELTDAVDRLLTLGEDLREHVPHVNHLGPHLDLNVHSGGFCALGRSGRIIEQNFRIANLNQKRGQARKIGEDWRNQRRL